MVKLNKVPVEIKEQVSKAIDLLCARLHGNIKAIYLYGSSVDGGLKPKSDIDLFVELSEPDYYKYAGLLKFLEEKLKMKVDLIRKGPHLSSDFLLSIKDQLLYA